MSAWIVNTPGWYGKVSFLGDFASRRLDAEFIARWDAWLQDMIASSRIQLGAAWLDIYLTSAVWRFVEWDRGGAIHAGVLMPSVDKVGRYFPLCIATKLPRLPVSSAEANLLHRWLDRFEAIALQSLDPSLGANAFDQRLLMMRASSDSEHDAKERDDARDAWDAVDPDVSLTAGDSLWWVGRSVAADASSFIVHTLPGSEQFIAMLRSNPVSQAG